MTSADIALGMGLKNQAGWNQVVADWQRLLELGPAGCFVAELDGVPAGTVATCPFGPVAWVAMMLVDNSFRSRGIGRALMIHALEHLDSMGVRTVRLDATDLGRPLYESLGFVAEATFAKYLGVLPRTGQLPRPSETSSSELIESAALLDFQVSGTDRRRLLRMLANEHPDSLQVVVEEGRLVGFLLARPGSNARRIGPCIASEPAAGFLLAEARRKYAGECATLDIPIANRPATELAVSWGLAQTGTLTRMGRGPRVSEDLHQIWASSGPEKG